MSRVRRGKFDVGKEILRHKDFTAIPVMLDGTQEVDGKSIVLENGRKVVKAGTLLMGKAASILEGETVAVTFDPANVDGLKVEGVLRYDVDITDGDREASLVIRGEVYEDKLPVALTAEVRTALATRILFIK